MTDETSPLPRTAPRWHRLVPWLITAACFVYLYTRLEHAAARSGRSLVPYLGAVFEHVSWPRWLALMVPYCVVFFAIDTLVVWRVIGWFNVKLRYTDVLPIRASAYILSIVNEQVSKGAMALYLSRRDRIPPWDVGSSMLFVMFCEYYYLLGWATIGVLLEWHRFPRVLHVIPYVAAGSLAVFVVVHLFCRGTIGRRVRWRDRPLLRSFRMATVGHYVTTVALRSPALLVAVVTYTLALRLFGVPVGAGEMLGYLPVIFFGAATPGPMHSVAIVLWVALFPEHPAEMTAFGLVQHNFFVFFNAAIGLVFVGRASRELFPERQRRA